MVALARCRRRIETKLRLLASFPVKWLTVEGH